jgi:hypothetical protein
MRREARRLYKNSELDLGAETFRLYAETQTLFGICQLPKFQIPNYCRNPKLLPKSQAIAKIPNCCRNPKLLPKSQTVAKISNCCQNPKSLPKSQTVAKILNCCQNPKFKRILAAIWTSATVWDFFGIWDLGIGIWDFGKMLKLYFGICQIPNLFRHI